MAKTNLFVLFASMTISILLLGAPTSELATGQEKGDKPLNLKGLIAREQAMKTELAKAVESGNQNLVQQTTEAHEKERASWREKTVTGIAEVTQVTGTQVGLFMDDSYPGKGGKLNKRIRFVFANAKDKSDPVLQTLKKGNLIEFTGVIDKRGRPVNGPFTINDAVFAVKK